MSRSTDGGQTWAASSVPNRSVIGGQPVVQPNGTVVVPIDSGPISSFVSTDGGASYQGPFTVSSINFHTPAGNLRDGGGLPSAEVDGGGTVYVAWADCRFRSGCSANDIVMSTSTDGQHWSSVVRIPFDPTTSTVDHFIAGIGVDRTTSGSSAHLGVTTYMYPTANCSASSCRLGVEFTSSTDGGATWTTPVQLFGNIQLSWIAPTSQGQMVGDYISTSFGSDGLAYPVISSARSTGVACASGSTPKCNEPMVAPRTGLALGPGTVPVGHEAVVAHAPHAAPTGNVTAF